MRGHRAPRRRSPSGLSHPQEWCIRVLRERDPAYVRSGYYGTRTNSLDSLVKLGLAECQLTLRLDYEYRITEEGRKFCRLHRLPRGTISTMLRPPPYDEPVSAV